MLFKMLIQAPRGEASPAWLRSLRSLRKIFATLRRVAGIRASQAQPARLPMCTRGLLYAGGRCSHSLRSLGHHLPPEPGCATSFLGCLPSPPLGLASQNCFAILRPSLFLIVSLRSTQGPACGWRSNARCFAAPLWPNRELLATLAGGDFNQGA